MRKLSIFTFDIRHVDSDVPLSYGVSDKYFVGTVDQMKDDRIFETMMSSTEPMYRKHFQSIQQELWDKAINLDERIKQIESGDTKHKSTT